MLLAERSRLDHLTSGFRGRRARLDTDDLVSGLLIIVGVAFGLLILRMPFGFMAILGSLGLSGMLIKNAVVLIDQIEFDRRSGKPAYEALLDAAVSRMRPVAMASGTTVLGMIPLLWDPFFKVMAATVAGGLIGSTALTLVVIPLFYAFAHRIKSDKTML